MTPDYDTACAIATTAQGLDPIVATLTAAGLPVEIEQTGGFCMVAMIHAADGGWMGITEDRAATDDTAGGYMIVVYRDAEDEGSVVAENVEVDHVADYARGYVRTHPAARPVEQGPTTTVEIPGTMLAKYRDGKIVGWTFLPSGSDAGYFGPSASIFYTDEDPQGDDEHLGLDVESTDGPFWTAVQQHLTVHNPFAVKWEE